jgi:hypothetical protein
MEDWPRRDSISVQELAGGRSRQLYSTSDIPDPFYPPAAAAAVPIRGCSSVDNLLEHRQQEDFMLKYRQVSGDLRSSCDLVQLARQQELETRDRSCIASKAVRKEKKKKRRWRNMSADRLVDDSSWSRSRPYNYQPEYCNEEVEEYDRLARHCYVNPGLVSSPLVSPSGNNKENLAPLAHQEICDLSPVVPPGGINNSCFNRHSKYNNSYRLATNHPATPLQRLVGAQQLPRTSTQISLDPVHVGGNQPTTKHHLLRGRPMAPPETADDCLYVRAEPYLCNSSTASRATSSYAPDPMKYREEEAVYTRPGPVGPLQRYTVSGIQVGSETVPLHRHSAARASRSSQATVDSGRYSDLRHVFQMWFVFSAA